jgi:HlyD family secretion protein
MTRVPKYVFTLALPLLAAAGGVAWLVGGGSGQGATSVVYETVEPTRGSIRKLVSTSGPVRALVTVSVGSQLSGQVEKLLVDFNSEVSEGDILAILDEKTFVAKVAQARADLATAKAQLQNALAAVEKADAVMRQSARTADRQQSLASKGIAAAAALDTATRDMEVAKAEGAVARAQVESAKAQIEQREAQLRQAEIDLERTRIRSPINGTVISRTIDIGQTVAASLQAPELFKIAQDLRRIRIEAQVNEADVGSVSEGNAVEFTVDAYPERRFRGLVTQVRLAATELNNVVTYTVIIEAENNDRKLYPGMTANVQIEADKRDGVVRIPVDAIRFRPRGVAAPATSGTGRMSQEDRERRTEELIEQLRSEVGLSEEQIAKVRDGLAKMRGERRGQGGGAGSDAGSQSGERGGEGSTRDMAQIRARIMQRTAEIVAAVVTPEQRKAFEAWKRNRETARTATVWILDATKSPVARQVRLGLADDQFAEVLGQPFKPGERVIVRAREQKK